MKVLMIGAGGVGDAAARIASERDFFDSWVVADYDLARAERTVAAVNSRRQGRRDSPRPRSTPVRPTRCATWPGPSRPRTCSTQSTHAS